jgi:hypothetical protein
MGQYFDLLCCAMFCFALHRVSGAWEEKSMVSHVTVYGVRRGRKKVSRVTDSVVWRE